MVGLLILQYGCSKWFGFRAPGPANVSAMIMVGWAGIIELIGGGLITAGLFTRCAAFIVSGEMAVGYWTQHFPRGWTPIGNGRSLITMYCFAALLLVFFGGGVWALDTLLRKKS